MGWKAIKDHYDIDFIVHVRRGNICIGQGAFPEALVVTPAGRPKKDNAVRSREIDALRAAIEADPAKFSELFAADDVFEKNVRVYSYRGAEIVEQFCEEPGYPNVTHDGDLMYENQHSTDKEQVVAWAKRNAEVYIEGTVSNIAYHARILSEQSARLDACRDNLDQLNAEYPEIQSASADAVYQT